MWKYYQNFLSFPFAHIKLFTHANLAPNRLILFKTTFSHQRGYFDVLKTRFIFLQFLAKTKGRGEHTTAPNHLILIKTISFHRNKYFEVLKLDGVCNTVIICNESQIPKFRHSSSGNSCPNFIILSTVVNVIFAIQCCSILSLIGCGDFSLLSYLQPTALH